MFKFVETLTFWWPVKVLEPDPANPGRLVEQEFEALFELPDPDLKKARADRRKTILQKIADAKTADDVEAAQAELDAYEEQVALETVKDWRKIIDQNDKPVPFGLFPKIYRNDRVKAAIARAYLDAISEDKARLGN